MGDTTGILQAARNHPILSVGAGAVAFVASIIQIVDSPTFSRFLGMEVKVEETAPSEDASSSPRDSGNAPGNLAIRRDAQAAPPVATAGPKSITFKTDGNSSQKNLLADVESSVRRDIAKAAATQTDVRLVITLESLSFGGSGRQAGFSYSIESSSLNGDCRASIGFGTNVELATQLAKRVSKTLNDSSQGEEVRCA